MGWKYDEGLAESWDELKSQSAFAGYGLEIACRVLLAASNVGRNPLSLDMGWK